MDEKIQLKHPTGKHAVRMDKSRYEAMRKAILKCLKNKSLTHTEMCTAIKADFKARNVKFEGSIEWYMESVKLDLEANNLVTRIKEKSLLKFQLT